MIAFDPGITVYGTRLDLLAEGLVIDLMLVHMLEPPEAEVLGAIEPLDEQVLLRGLQTPHEFDTTPPALVGAFTCDVTVGFVITVHA